MKLSILRYIPITSEAKHFHQLIDKNILTKINNEKSDIYERNVIVISVYPFLMSSLIPN